MSRSKLSPSHPHNDVAAITATAVRGRPVPLPPNARFPREGILWIATTGALLLTGLYKGINLLLLLAYLLIGLMAINYVLARRQLRSLHARRLPSGPIVAGQVAQWRVEVSNSGARALRGCMIEDRGPDHLLRWFVLRLDRHCATDLRGTVVLACRGKYRCEPLRAWTRFPFGLIHRMAELSCNEDCIVLPRTGVIQGDRLRHWLARATRGDGRIHRRIRHVAASEADVHGLRVFRPGDSPRWIHWKTSARRNEWMVREFEDSAPPHLLLVVEPWLPAQATAAQLERLEALISLAASVCREWCREPGSRLTLVIARKDAVVLDGATGPELSLRMLEALAIEEGSERCDPATWLTILGRLTTTPVLVMSSQPGLQLADQIAAILGRPVARVDASEPVSWYNPPAAQNGT